jgi:hypothetical protein
LKTSLAKSTTFVVEAVSSAQTLYDQFLASLIDQEVGSIAVERESDGATARS